MLKKEKKDQEYEWLSGLTDGDGYFSFSPNKRKSFIWHCTYKIHADSRNLQLLNYCRGLLKHGKIKARAIKGKAEFRIRKRAILRELIKPLFEKYPLYTHKAFYFAQWCCALNVLDSPQLSQEEKQQQLLALYKDCKEQPPTDYTPPAWRKAAPSKRWVCGFIEAKGSFFIVNQGGEQEKRLSHFFRCTHKWDPYVLEHIRSLFHLPGKIAFHLVNHMHIYKLESSNFRGLIRIKSYFKDGFRGRKSLVFRIWERTLKWRGKSHRLERVQQLLDRLEKGETTALTTSRCYTRQNRVH